MYGSIAVGVLSAKLLYNLYNQIKVTNTLDELWESTESMSIAWSIIIDNFIDTSKYQIQKWSGKETISLINSVLTTWSKNSEPHGSLSKGCVK